MSPSLKKKFCQEQLRELFAAQGTKLAFQPHNFIYTPNHAAQSLYLLETGQVSLQILSTEGRILTLQMIEEQQIFGYMALTKSLNYDTFAETTKVVSVLALSHETILREIATKPTLGLTFLEALAHYRLLVSRRLDEVAFKSVTARLASLFLDMAGASSEEQPFRLPPRTHQQLAEMINAYRETVTKVINQFRAAKLLDIDRSGITLLNLSRLRELAQN